MTTLQAIEAGIIGEIIAVSNANQATVEAWIGTGEADVKAQLASLIKEIPSVKGALAIVAAPLEAAAETAVETYVADVIAKETPQALFELYIAGLTSLQAKVSA